MIQKIKHSAILSLGFRPFYLLASGYVAISFTVFLYWVLNPSSSADFGYDFHAHELIFGFASAVLVGFLLTAVQNWTQKRTVWGFWLTALAIIWLVGRIGPWTDYPVITSTFGSLFLPFSALAIAIPIFQSRNFRNLPLVFAVLVLAFLDVSANLRELELVHLSLPVTEAHLALSIFALVITLMAGRVIPAFTQNAVPTAKVRINQYVEILAFVSMALVVFADFLDFLPAQGLGFIALLATLIHLLRLWLWDPMCTQHEPLLWILPIGYLWIPIFLAFNTLRFFEILPTPFFALHALSAGAIGCLMVGMMTRSSRGHTGHELKADRFDLTMYLLVIAGGVIRVFGVAFLPAYTQTLLAVSGTLWAAGFLLFFLAYFRRLIQPRTDATTVVGNT